ncbi:thiosulfate/3-mercaptopyruvate sulfurtransferase [Frankia sp. AiPs1]|uniref:rhodanese-like domain-containing protein n=1 Tax=Frankia sp. AiPa1 TaxID=573492 RepID=UPI00202B87BE|nr:rhodanese-like domain-containing protein [Frankia sp. AiPa1]MCL9762038.1 rhodanese-like domain-containing protein [Frankia sp. AiPa1]
MTADLEGSSAPAADSTAASRRYVIIGAGAVGATVAAELHLAGIGVVLVARGANLAALRESGLRYIRPPRSVGGPAVVHQLDLPVLAGPDEADLRSGDVLVLATKSQDSEAVLAQWAWAPVDGGASTAAEALPVVLLQNGLDSARAALRRFATVLDAVVYSPSSHLRPAEVISPARPSVAGFLLGRAPFAPAVPGGSPGAVVDGAVVDGAVVEGIAGDLRRAASAVLVVDDITRWKAGKLLGNLAYNLDAIYPPGPRRDTVAAELVTEARRVFAAAGIDVADVRSSPLDLSGLTIAEIPGYARGGSSTWQSLARGGSVESDYLNGEIVLLARLHGLTAPINAGVQARIATASRLGARPGGLGDDDLEALLALAATNSATATATTGPAAGPAGRVVAGEVLVEAKALQDELTSATPPLLLDVRWALGDPDGHDHYREGHLPGAVFVDLETELSDHALAAAPGGTAGRHPLPAVDELQRAARRWGLRAGRGVVVYDDAGGLSAARAWWLLRWAGVRDVRILDGALRAWRGAGLPLETGEIIPAPGDVVLTGGHLPVLDADAAGALARDGILLDARAGERYRGEVEPVDPRAGHIPGAISAATGDNLDATGRFRPADELRARFAALGVPVRATAEASRSAPAPTPAGAAAAASGAGSVNGAASSSASALRAPAATVLAVPPVPAQAGPADGANATVGVYCGSGVTAAHQIAALAIAGVDAALYAGSWSAWSSDPARPVATGAR